MPPPGIFMKQGLGRYEGVGRADTEKSTVVYDTNVPERHWASTAGPLKELTREFLLPKEEFLL